MSFSEMSSSALNLTVVAQFHLSWEESMPYLKT